MEHKYLIKIIEKTADEIIERFPNGCEGLDCKDCPLVAEHDRYESAVCEMLERLVKKK